MNNAEYYTKNKNRQQIGFDKYRKKIRNKAFQALGNGCEICHEPPNFSLKKINLCFHHRYYDETGRTNFIVELDAEKSKGATRIYKSSLKNPEMFMLLCQTCHKIIGISKLNLRKILLCNSYLESKTNETIAEDLNELDKTFENIGY